MRPVLARSVAVFVLTFGMVGAGSWIPTQSRDEAATVSAVTRSWSALLAMLDNVDVVHGLYYASMKVWLDAVGISTLSLRAPSVLACAAAAALVVVLGSVLANPRAGLLAGLVMAVAPRFTLIATEGRAAALFTAATVALVLAVVLATRRPSRWWCPAAALLTAVLGFLHIYTLLLLPVLLVYLGAALPRGRGRAWRLAAFWRARHLWPALGLVLGAVPVGWLALQARDQQAQVDWIDPPTLGSLANVATETFSPRNGLWAVLAWGAATAGLLWLGRHRKRHRGATVLLVGWTAWPVLALITVSAVWSPLYSHRYLAFCLGGLALLAGMGLASVKRSAIAFVIAASLPLAGLVSYRNQREVDAWDNWQQVMDVVRYRANPGDVMVSYPLVSALTVSYPDGYAGIPVINAGTDRLTRRHLWDERLPLAQVEQRLAGVRRVWYLSPGGDEVRRTAELSRLRQLGFRGEMLERTAAEQTWLFSRTPAKAAEHDRRLRTPG